LTIDYDLANDISEHHEIATTINENTPITNNYSSYADVTIPNIDWLWMRQNYN